MKQGVNERLRALVSRGDRRSRGFTRIEMLVMIVIVVILVAGLFPGLGRARRQAKARACAANLKQVGIGFRTWCVGSIDTWQTGVSTNSGGTKELIESGQVFVHFQAMSNELSTPKILVCPSDLTKTVPTNLNVGFSDSNVSYFVGTDARDTYPYTLLCGDRNLALNGQPLKPGLFVLTRNNTALSWTRTMHESCGNILRGDGAVEFLESKQLPNAALQQGLATNRLAIP